MRERWITHRRAGWTVSSIEVGPSRLERLVAAGLCLGMLVGALGSLLGALSNPSTHRDRIEPSVVERRGWTPEEHSGPPIRVDLRPGLDGSR